MYLHIKEGDRPSPPTSTVLITETEQEERKTAGSRPPVTYLPSVGDRKILRTVRQCASSLGSAELAFLNRELDVHTHTGLHYPLHMADGTENTSRLHGSPERREKHRQNKKSYTE